MTKRRVDSKKLRTREKSEPEDETIDGIVKTNIGLNWKIVLPGLGLLGLTGVASRLFMKKRRQALLAVTGSYSAGRQNT